MLSVKTDTGESERCRSDVGSLYPVLDLESRLRCRECDARVKVSWAAGWRNAGSVLPTKVGRRLERMRNYGVLSRPEL